MALISWGQGIKSTKEVKGPTMIRTLSLHHQYSHYTLTLATKQEHVMLLVQHRTDTMNWAASNSHRPFAVHDSQHCTPFWQLRRSSQQSKLINVVRKSSPASRPTSSRAEALAPISNCNGVLIMVSKIQLIKLLQPAATCEFLCEHTFCFNNDLRKKRWFFADGGRPSMQWNIAIPKMETHYGNQPVTSLWHGRAPCSGQVLSLVDHASWKNWWRTSPTTTWQEERTQTCFSKILLGQAWTSEVHHGIQPMYSWNKPHNLVPNSVTRLAEFKQGNIRYGCVMVRPCPIKNVNDVNERYKFIHRCYPICIYIYIYIQILVHYFIWYSQYFAIVVDEEVRVERHQKTLLVVVVVVAGGNRAYCRILVDPKNRCIQ